MATKAEITTHINTDLASGSLIPASNHRGVLHTDTDSILENVYMTPITDISSGVKTITTSNANFDYTVTFTKVGRSINVKGTFENISGSAKGAGAVVFDITDTEYDVFRSVNANSVLRTGVFENGMINMNVTNSFILISTVLDGETFNFNFNYDALN